MSYINVPSDPRRCKALYLGLTMCTVIRCPWSGLHTHTAQRRRANRVHPNWTGNLVACPANLGLEFPANQPPAYLPALRPPYPISFSLSSSLLAFLEYTSFRIPRSTLPRIFIDFPIFPIFFPHLRLDKRRENTNLAKSDREEENSINWRIV